MYLIPSFSSSSPCFTGRASLWCAPPPPSPPMGTSLEVTEKVQTCSDTPPAPSHSFHARMFSSEGGRAPGRPMRRGGCLHPTTPRGRIPNPACCFPPASPSGYFYKIPANLGVKSDSGSVSLGSNPGGATTLVTYTRPHHPPVFCH